jgi:hypothetical protein
VGWRVRSSLHLHIALRVSRRRRAVCPRFRHPVRRRLGILRCTTATAATREWTPTRLHRRGILARLTFALDLRRQRDDISRADLRELR